MLQGFDFSHYQSDSQVAAHISGVDFVFHKLTEGTAYVDPKALARAQYLNGTSFPVFWYHVIRPDKNSSAAAEASHFVATLKRIEDKVTAHGVAIDIENAFLPYGCGDFSFVYDFIRYLHKADYQPIIYCGDLYPDEFYHTLCELGCPVWIARYGRKPEHDWDFWQDTSKYNGENLDHDYCAMNKTQLKNLMVYSENPGVSAEENLLKLALVTLIGENGSGEQRKKVLGNKYSSVQKIINLAYQEAKKL